MLASGRTDPEKLTLSSSLECRLDSEPRYLDVRLPKPEKGRLSKGKPAALNPDAERRRVDVRITLECEPE